MMTHVGGMESPTSSDRPILPTYVPFEPGTSVAQVPGRLPVLSSPSRPPFQQAFSSLQTPSPWGSPAPPRTYQTETGIDAAGPRTECNGPETEAGFRGQPLSSKEQRKQGWRWKGYPAFATFLASDHDAFVVRRFGTLHARTILMLQDRIVRLEAQLEEQDRMTLLETEDYKANNGSLRIDEAIRPIRTEILDELTTLLEKYDRLVWYHSELKARPQASRRAIKNVQRWHEDNEKAIADPEKQFINAGNDVIAVVHREKPPLRRFLERSAWFMQCCAFRKREPESHHYNYHYNTDRSVYYSDRAVDIFVTGTILVLGLGMLLGPAWWLQRAGSLVQRLGIICIFVPLFMLLLLLVAPFRPFETVAATSAYTAVLMVFMQIGSNNCTGPRCGFNTQ